MHYLSLVLYPGVDPTPWVEELGKSKGITTENGLFANISMGQVIMNMRWTGEDM